MCVYIHINGKAIYCWHVNINTLGNIKTSMIHLSITLYVKGCHNSRVALTMRNGCLLSNNCQR